MRQTKFLCEFQLKLFALIFYFPHLIIRPGEVPLCRVAEDGQSKMNEYLEYKNDYLIFNIFWYSIFSDIQYLRMITWYWNRQWHQTSRPAWSAPLWHHVWICWSVHRVMISFIHVIRTIIFKKFPQYCPVMLLWPVASSISQTVLVRERESLPEE